MCFSCGRILVALFCTFSKASMSYFEVNHISFVLQSLFRLSDSNSDEYIHSPPRGVSRECGVALYGAYAPLCGWRQPGQLRLKRCWG